MGPLTIPARTAAERHGANQGDGVTSVKGVVPAPGVDPTVSFTNCARVTSWGPVPQAVSARHPTRGAAAEELR